jgi:hypothetical protein
MAAIGWFMAIFICESCEPLQHPKQVKLRAVLFWSLPAENAPKTPKQKHLTVYLTVHLTVHLKTKN